MTDIISHVVMLLREGISDFAESQTCGMQRPDVDVLPG